MTDELLEQKLTPAARQVLSELTNDFRQQLLRDAAKQAESGSGRIHEISVSDVIKSTELIQTKKFPPRLLREEGLAIFSVIFGVLLFFASLLDVRALFIMPALPFLDSIRLGQATLGLMGLLFISMGITVFAYTRREDIFNTIFPKDRPTAVIDNKADFSFDFIRKWQELEINARAYSARQLGDSKTNTSLRELINNMQSIGILNNEETKAVFEALEIRNRILHKGENIDRAKYLRLTRELDDILLKIK